MLEFHSLSEFSRSNCVGICAFLVPANILATVMTLFLTFVNRPRWQVFQSAGIASVFSFFMVWHVYTWFSIGVIMPPTYILLSLGTTCLLTNLGAIVWRVNFRYGTPSPHLLMKSTAAFKSSRMKSG
ncbi:MAG: hypothetical protein VKL02_06935 [Cylindrospermopsis raciborskii 1523720]|nr:hypothetical protein [Cylindrospermopsis raciborskii]MEB3145859.1 hypothetical protein [Cylindrospermopsis raciborskii]